MTTDHHWQRSVHAEGGFYCTRCAQPKTPYWARTKCDPSLGGGGHGSRRPSPKPSLEPA